MLEVEASLEVKARAYRCGATLFVIESNGNKNRKEKEK